MERIMVIGCCGAGKSTLSTRLHQILGLPIIHLDQVYWKPNWTESDPDVWQKAVSKIVQQKQWIIDGNYGSTMDTRLAHADTVIYLDFPTRICLSRILKRTWKYHGQTRPDMQKDCPERYSLEFFHYVLTFNWVRRAGLLKRIDKAAQEKDLIVHRLTNDREVATFIEQLKV